MNPWQIALIELVAKVGLDTAILVASNINKAATIDDAIAALKETQKKTWADYVTEAQAQQ